MKNKRKLLFRVAAILIVLAIAAVMFVIGRGHTVYFDNREAAYSGKTAEPFYSVKVTVGDQKPAKLKTGDRGMAEIMGQKFTMTVEITDKEGDAPHAHKVSMAVPYNMDGILINIPALMAGLPQEAYMSEFVIQEPEDSSADEEIVTDELDNIGGDL